MDNNWEIIIDFVLDKAVQEPVHKRVQLYRSLAEVCGDEQETRRLHHIADQFSEAEKSCRDFNFSFSEKTKATRPK